MSKKNDGFFKSMWTENYLTDFDDLSFKLKKKYVEFKGFKPNLNISFRSEMTRGNKHIKKISKNYCFNAFILCNSM